MSKFCLTLSENSGEKLRPSHQISKNVLKLNPPHHTTRIQILNKRIVLRNHIHHKKQPIRSLNTKNILIIVIKPWKQHIVLNKHLNRSLKQLLR